MEFSNLYLCAIFAAWLTASLKLVRYMEEQGKEWQPAASLRELAGLSELRRDAVKVDETVLPWGSPNFCCAKSNSDDLHAVNRKFLKSRKAPQK